MPHLRRQAWRPREAGAYGHIQPKNNRAESLESCRCLRSLHPPQIRIAIVLDNFSPHLTTRKDTRAGDRAEADNVEFACVPANSSCLDRIEALAAARHTRPGPGGRADRPGHARTLLSGGRRPASGRPRRR